MPKKVVSNYMGPTGRWVAKDGTQKVPSTTLVQRNPKSGISVTKIARKALTGEFVVPLSRVANLGEIGFTNEEIYRIVAPRRTLDRRRKNNEPLTLTESDRVQRLERVMEHAIRVFGNEEKASRWLRKPNRALDKAVPIELLESETGAQVVDEELHAIDHGMYA